MKLIKKGIRFENNEPAIRSCYECNLAHEHLRNTEFIHVCYDCGRYWIKGKYLNEFKTDEDLRKFLKKIGIKEE